MPEDRGTEQEDGFAFRRNLLGKGEGGVGDFAGRQLEEGHVAAPVGCDQLEGLSSDLGEKASNRLLGFLITRHAVRTNPVGQTMTPDPSSLPPTRISMQAGLIFL